MNLYEVYGRDEAHPLYRKVESSNYTRQLDFLHSMIESAVESKRPWLSEALIKALNFHAIVALHNEAGQYRSAAVNVEDSQGNIVHKAPEHFLVAPLMTDFVNEVNWLWEHTDATALAAYALWRINYIHPFVNGNGRTARAICYFILCVKSGGLLPGRVTLLQLLRETKRQECEAALKLADENADLAPLIALVKEAISIQLEATGDQGNSTL